MDYDGKLLKCSKRPWNPSEAGFTGFHMLPYSSIWNVLEAKHGTYGREGQKFHIWRGLLIMPE
jgi:hypothetical protein